MSEGKLGVDLKVPVIFCFRHSRGKRTNFSQDRPESCGDKGCTRGRQSMMCVRSTDMCVHCLKSGLDGKSVLLIDRIKILK